MDCINKKCSLYNVRCNLNCGDLSMRPDQCEYYLKAKKDGGSKVPCSVGLEGLLIKAGKQLHVNANLLRIEGFVEMAIDSEVIFAEIAVKLNEGKE